MVISDNGQCVLRQAAGHVQRRMDRSGEPYAAGQRNLEQLRRGGRIVWVQGSFSGLVLRSGDANRHEYELGGRTSADSERGAVN